MRSPRLLACVNELSLPRATTSIQSTGSGRVAPPGTDKPPAYLLRLFGIHQRFHRYVPRFDYLSGASNHIADALSRDFHLTW
ncbi:hypothetical protein ACHAWF_000323, partial [Thalassiosira exigua]